MDARCHANAIPFDERGRRSHGSLIPPAWSSNPREGPRGLRLLHDGEAKRRLRIFLRHTGSFYFQEEYFSEHPLEECWIPVAGGGVGFYDSEQTALREATAELDWLRHC